MITTLITGANRGLGLEVARQLGAIGHQVVLGVRSAEAGLETEIRLREEGRSSSIGGREVYLLDCIAEG